MASQHDIDYVLRTFTNMPPARIVKKVDETAAGIGHVLRTLDGAGGSMTAGQIADEMNVSTARVAVLLKNMEAKGFITRTKSADDARVTVVSFAKKGSDFHTAMKRNIEARVGHMIDVLGIERVRDFLETASIIMELTDNFTPPPFDKIERESEEALSAGGCEKAATITKSADNESAGKTAGEMAGAGETE